MNHRALPIHTREDRVAEAAEAAQPVQVSHLVTIFFDPVTRSLVVILSCELGLGLPERSLPISPSLDEHVWVNQIPGDQVQYWVALSSDLVACLTAICLYTTSLARTSTKATLSLEWAVTRQSRRVILMMGQATLSFTPIVREGHTRPP